ncbi:NAD(P)-binding protein [Acetobacter sp. LMG 1627]|uniref:Ferredoxin--NADP reductase n=2 Tax=Acetobacter conturbans TaxID=1737472 RepID=A0ABX0K3C9_9PROT|nr:NAD(P)-binding protein [Acetobacter conturbans]
MTHKDNGKCSRFRRVALIMSGATISTDVVIIGAGPAGLFAAFQCSMLKIGCVLVDALDEIGGQCVALYPEKPIYDIPACPAIEGAQLIERLAEQIEPFGVERLLGRRIEGLSGASGDFHLTTDKGDTLRTKAVIIAAGAGAFGPNRPPLEDLTTYETSGAVRYSVRRKAEFADKSLVIAGGGDSAIDWALSLSRIAKKIYLVHRRDKFRAAPESLSQLEEAIARGVVEKITPYQLKGLQGDGSRLAGVEVATLTGETRLLEAEHLLAFFGLATDLGPIAQWGIDQNRSTIPVVPSTCQTSLPGIFAIGDIASYPGKLKLILQGFSEGAMAAHAIYPIVNPHQALHFEYSTSKGVPGSE